MSGMAKSPFYKTNPKKQVRCIITTNRFNVGPKLCVNTSTKGRKNITDIIFWFQQVHPSKARIIIHNCKKISKTIMCCQIKSTPYVYMQQIKRTLWNKIGNRKLQPLLLSQMTNRTMRWMINHLFGIQYILQ